MNIPIYKPWITKKEIDIVQDAISSSWISSKGIYIDLFEEKFSEFIGSKYSVSLNNGTSACHIALLSCGIKEGDEVIVPSCAFIACINAVSYCKAKPILADIDEHDWNISLEEIKKKKTPKTKAVFLVHTLGNPCKQEIYDWCNDNNILCIEDACESIGASLNNKKTGILGKCGAFSFFGNKNITTGEGGMLTTNDLSIKEIANYLKGQAQDSTYIHGDIGYNYRMTNIQAAIGYSQIQRIDEIMSEKNRVFDCYTKNLSILISESFRLQKITKNSKHSNWMFAFYSKNKDKIKINLEKNGIETRPMFYPVNHMKPYYSNEIFEKSIDINKHCLMLPSYPELRNEDIEKICEIIKSAN